MGSYSVEIEVPLPIDKVLVACQKAMMQFNWAIATLSDSLIQAKVKATFSLAYPQTVEVRFTPRGPSTSVSILVKVIAVGRAAYLQRVAGTLVNALSLAAQTEPESAPSAVGLAAEIQKLGDLYSSGLLTAEEFQEAKQKLLHR